ncbi:MAG: diaminopimelate epimerase [Alphaproteobacteria bacterium]|jgi:diaminopimelate epimerase|nr:diaminopimelate epimerase [Alphaproteobacteria bacterium]
MANRKFIKMHGLGNDFVIIDARSEPFSVDAVKARALANRNTGIGCDQLIIMEPSDCENAIIFMKIINSDGTEVSACGNATRCVARLVVEETGLREVFLQTKAGLIKAHPTDANSSNYTVDMGPVNYGWQNVPLAYECDTNHLPLSFGELQDPSAVNVGNPHIVFFVEDLDAVKISHVGPILEHNSLFPERTNVGFAKVIDKNNLILRVWERGAGLTQACGSGACAAVVNAHRRNLTDRKATVKLDGGTLDIEWLTNDHVTMTGPTEISYKGSFEETQFEFDQNNE